MKARPFFCNLFLLSLFLSYASPAWGHKVNIFAYVQGGTCFVEGYYSKSRKAQNALIEVFDKKGRKLLEGKTDAKGEFSFKVPGKADLRIVLTASLGHKNDFTIRADEIAGRDEETAVPGSPPPEIPDLRQTQEEHPAEPNDRIAIGPGELEEMINRSLDNKLKPLFVLISRTQAVKEVSARDIFAGIGYIVGICGLAAFILRKNGRPRP